MSPLLLHSFSRRLFTLPLLTGLVALLGGLGPFTSSNRIWADDTSGELRVMTFNIRYGTAKDGENHWDKRKDHLVEAIVRFNPDLLGTQETLKFQRDYLAEQLKDYAVLGVGRDDGKESGEMMAVYYKRSRFEAIESGHFWLSESPDEVGSKSWDSSLPRMVTWVKLRDRNNATAKPIAFFNTHFDHRGPEARQESARLLRAKAEEIGQGCSIIITGDFNCGESSAPYQALFSGDAPVVDAYRSVHPNREPNEGTYSGFDASATSGDRIDWICISKDWQVVSAAIDHSARDNRLPSDHFPVTAVLKRQ